MKKLKLKLNRDELTELSSIVNTSIQLMSPSPEYYDSLSWTDKLVRSVLRDVVLPSFMRKLINPVMKMSFTLKEFEAEALWLACRQHEVETSNPYTIALIQKVKNTQLV